MAGLAAIQLAAPPMLFDGRRQRLGASGLALLLLVFSFALPALAVVWLVTAVLVGQVVFELGRHDVHAAGGVELDL